MKKNKILFLYFLFLLLFSSYSYPQYNANPFIFSIEECPEDGCFFVYDVNGDNNPDFIFRSMSNLYVYDHYGSLLWDKEISMIDSFEVNGGNKSGAADVDGDGKVEIVALNAHNEILIYDGETGTIENMLTISVDDTTQFAANMVLVNQRYAGSPQKKRDVIIQTNGRPDISKYWRSINRTLIVLNLESGEEIWRLQQNDNILDGIYEGYFGQRHGGPVCADIDLDGIDEIIGGNVIDYNNGNLDIIDPGDYEHFWKRWVDKDSKAGSDYIDHIDAISVGDFRSDIPGLEWVISEEDNIGAESYHTVMFSKDSIIWRKMTELYEGGDREPQNVCAGNFDNDLDYAEVWNRSRLPKNNGSLSQHPWVYDAIGNQIADYAMEDVLPADFNPAGNKEGIEEVWTIDWAGADKENIAGMARHTHLNGIPGGNVIILDAVSGEVFWSTFDHDPQTQAYMLYVADVTGDNREEIIICDVSNSDYRIKIYVNENSSKKFVTNKWRDPLYSQLKQSWNYYSPGSYTKGGSSSIFNVQIKDITPLSVVISWYTDEPCNSSVHYGFTEEYNEGSIVNNSYVTKHEVELSDLEPDTKYHYKINCRNQKNKLVKTPDNMFTTGQKVTLLHPQGGETFHLDSLVTVQWSIPSGHYGVNLEISRDSGTTWKPLFSQVINDTSVTWRVDEPPSPHCLINVKHEDGYFSDTTEHEFTIMDTTKQLVFTPSEQVIEQGIISDTLTVDIQNTSGENIILNYDYIFSLQTTSSTGEFSVDSVSWDPVTQVSIDSGSSSITFFYRDNTLGHSEIMISEIPSVGWKDDTLKNIVLLENTDFLPPELSYFYPFPGKRYVPLNSAIRFKIGDPESGSGIDTTSLKLFINSNRIKYNQSDISKIGKNFLFNYIPDEIQQNSWISVNVQCKDSVINYLDTTFTFLSGKGKIIHSCENIINPDGGTLVNEENGVEVYFPTGAVGDTLYFIIGETDSIPPLPDSTLAIAKYYYTGPPGLQLNKKITVSLPYDESILNKAGIRYIDQLPVYLYNFNNWEKLSIENYTDDHVIVKTNSTGYITFLLENEDYLPPKIFYCFPFPYTRSVPVNNLIQFKIGDSHSGFGTDIGSLKLSINNTDIEYSQSNITKMGRNFLFHYTPDSILQEGNVLMHIQCQDSVFNKVDTMYTFITGNSRIINSYEEIIYPGDQTSISFDTIGVEVDFPADAIKDTLYFTIGETDSIPQLPDSAAAIGKYYYLGPPGLKLNKKFTVSLPCDENLLYRAEVTGVDQLPVYLYDFNNWQKLSVISFSDSQVSVQTNSTGYITFCNISSSDVTEWVQDASSKHTWKLRQNYPNPFNPNTSIKYYLAEECFVSIRVYDLLGRFIRELVAERQNEGFHSVEWNGTDFEGKNLPSGIYLLQMEVNDYAEMRKMILRR